MAAHRLREAHRSRAYGPPPHPAAKPRRWRQGFRPRYRRRTDTAPDHRRYFERCAAPLHPCRLQRRFRHRSKTISGGPFAARSDQGNGRSRRDQKARTAGVFPFGSAHFEVSLRRSTSFGFFGPFLAPQEPAFVAFTTTALKGNAFRSSDRNDVPSVKEKYAAYRPFCSTTWPPTYSLKPMGR